MRGQGAWLVAAAIVGSLLLSQPAGAESIAISPLEYREVLTEGSVQKGYVDIVNPDTEAKNIKIRVQEFTQVDDSGGLSFKDSDKLSRGVLLDLDSAALGPGEGVRVYFLLDSNNLPAGDVFAAIMASTTSTKTSGVNSAAQVGTLLLIQNGKAPSHTAEIASLSAKRLQLDNAVRADFVVRNIDSPNSEALGFTPEITVSIKPYFSQAVDGPLLFTGRQREVTFNQAGSYFGPVVLSVKTGSSQASVLLFVMTGFYQWLAPLLAVVAVTGIIALVRFKKAKSTTTA